MNVWAAKLGCEVNVCQAKHCDSQRMEICALRANYLWRVRTLMQKHEILIGTPLARSVARNINKLGWEYIDDEWKPKDN